MTQLRAETDRLQPFDIAAFDAVIFDCDGVVSDSEPLSVAAWTSAVADHGLEVTKAEVGTFIGQTEAQLARHYGPRVGVPATDMEAGARRAFLALVSARGISPFPDAAELVGRLVAAGMPLGMGSNSPRWRLDAVLRGTGMAAHFPVTVAGDEVAEPKPAPDVYLTVAGRLGVDPRRTVVLEDTPTGIRSARAAGCTVVGVHRGAVPRSTLEIADLVVDGLWPD